MTKAELIKMLEGIGENEELVFMKNNIYRECDDDEKFSILMEKITNITTVKAYEIEKAKRTIKINSADIKLYERTIARLEKENAEKKEKNTKANVKKITENNEVIKTLREKIEVYKNDNKKCAEILKKYNAD